MCRHTQVNSQELWPIPCRLPRLAVVIVDCPGVGVTRLLPARRKTGADGRWDRERGLRNSAHLEVGSELSRTLAAASCAPCRCRCRQLSPRDGNNHTRQDESSNCKPSVAAYRARLLGLTAALVCAAFLPRGRGGGGRGRRWRIGHAIIAPDPVLKALAAAHWFIAVPHAWGGAQRRAHASSFSLLVRVLL